jgi:hypothetical protein
VQENSSPWISAASFDHLVGARDECRRHFEAERLGRFEIDEQLDFHRLLDGEIGGLSPLEYISGVETELPIRIEQVGSVAYETTGLNKLRNDETAGTRCWAASAAI